MAKRHRYVEEDESDEQDEEEQQDEEVPETQLEDEGPSHAMHDEPMTGRYKRGTIKKIVVKDFMTYQGKMTIRPGPRLNLVLGPNGTGKSSLVCAMCVGLGFAAKLLGRSDNLVDYIRRSCSSCYVEITLSGGGGRGARGHDVVIRRDISKDGSTAEGRDRYKSEFRRNGARVTAEQVKKEVDSLQIQLDNLCQFLPQDKVSSFSAMNSRELLEATERAQGMGELWDDHEQLKAGQVEIKNLEAELARKTRDLRGEQQIQERNQRDYERYKRREELKERIYTLRARMEWLRVMDLKAKAREAKASKEEAQRAWDECQTSYEEEEKPVLALEKKVKECEKRKRDAHQDLQAAKTKYNSALRKVTEVREELDQEVEKIKDLEVRSKRWHKEVADLQREVAGLQSQLETMPRDVPQEMHDQAATLREQLNVAHKARTDAEVEANELYPQIEDLEREMRRITEDIHRLGDSKRQRLQQWNQRYRPGILDVHSYMERMRHEGRFRGPVFGPVILEMNMRPNADPKWANYVERQCGGVMFNFVVTNREDDDLLSNYIKQKNYRFVVNTVDYNYNSPIQHPSGEASEYQQYGVLATLDTVFDAPPLVKRMLCDLANIHRVYIGNDAAGARASEIFRNTQIRTLYSGDQQMSYSVSQYNAAAATIENNTVRPAQNLGAQSTAQVDAEVNALRQRLAQLEQEKQGLTQRFQQYQQTANHQKQLAETAHRGLSQITEEQKRVHAEVARAEVQLNNKRAVLHKKAQAGDPIHGQADIKAKCQSLVQKMKTVNLQLRPVFQGYWAALQKHMVAEMQFVERREQEAVARKRYEEVAVEQKRLERQLNEATDALARAAAAFNQAKARFTTEYPMTPDLDAAIKEVPTSDLEELQRQVDDTETEVEQIVCNDPNIIAEYERRDQSIKELEKAVDDLTGTLNLRRAEFDEVVDRWLPALRELVTNINGGFSTNFSRIACAGEVVLHEPEDKYNFDQYAIQILVKFRETEALQVLDTHHQSGGERSVSTILYLIALQGVTQTPFRVVDEINQGMDQINERKVFGQLVESSSKPDTPQCFLLTPKLLDDLTYNHQITVLQIMNGGGIRHVVIDEAAKCMAREPAPGYLGMLLGASTHAQAQAEAAGGAAQEAY